jgi:ferredoxin-NADP reductase
MDGLEVKIKEIIQRTYNVISFRLEIPEPKEYQAGQFLLVAFKTNPELKRYLSISSSPTERGYIEFTKKITESDFCKVLTTLRVGDALIVGYPFGKFTLDDPKAKIAFLSGGIGITPIRSICKYVVDRNLGTNMVLLYSNRTINDIAFKEDFELMQRQYPKLKVVHVLCEVAPGFVCAIGRINAQVIKDNIPDYAQRKFYLCGPPAMVEGMKKILGEELALPKENIITENFVGY